jgi:CDP-paratose 2-epimerase
MKPSHVLITGGCGFIGTNLAERILSRGERVLLFDNLARAGSEKNLAYLRAAYGSLLDVEIADVRNSRQLTRAARSASAVFHLSAQVAVTSSLAQPREDFDINARGTLNLLEALRARTTPAPIVFTSTNKVYGALEDVALRATDRRYVPADASLASAGVSEQRALDFHSPYGCSKGAADQYVLDYARSYRMPAVVFRMSCIYGRHQHGNEDQGWVAHLLLRAIAGEPITLYGDGKQVRDVLFADDLVDAFLLARDGIGAISGRAFNMGGGAANAISLLELLELIERLHGSPAAVTFGDWRTGDQHYYVSDTRAFQRATSWRPRVGAHEGIRLLYQWLLGSRGGKTHEAARPPRRAAQPEARVAAL